MRTSCCFAFIIVVTFGVLKIDGTCRASERETHSHHDETSHHSRGCHKSCECQESECECHDPDCYGVCLDPGRPAKPKRKSPGDVDRGDCPPKRYLMDDCSRSGKAHCVHRFAKCSVNDKYSAWFVGGGAAFFRGRCRTEAEGTWGLDYNGLFGHANNWLKYTKGRKHEGQKQGGEGAYRTDGEPKVVARAKSLFSHE